MTTVGYATLSVIPSFQGFGAQLQRGMAAPMIAAGSRAGAATGTAAATGFRSKFQGGLAGIGPKLVGALGVAAIGKEVVGLQGEFESSMNVLAESADVPAADMQRLAQFAKDMGASTVFSAGEAADAMVELAKAGLKPAEIEAGALKATMAVAATEGLGLAESATIMSNAMTTFRIEGARATEVADALAGGSKASTASVASLSEAMSQVGGSARDAGLSLQDTVAVLAAFDQEGIKGSDAGTSLKTMLARLVPQTDKAANAMDDLGLSFTDANGQFLPIAQVAGQLRKAFVGLSDAERTTALNTIFGADARRAALALIEQGESGIREFTDATSEMGAAQRLADARMSGTKGALEELSGALENAGLAAGEALAPGIVAGSKGLTSLINAAVGLPAPIQSAALAFVALKAAAHFGATPQAGIGKLSAATDTLRLRAMFAADQYRNLRTTTRDVGGQAVRVSSGVGRLSAAMQVAGTAAGRMGGALRTGLGGAVGMLGGPWGLAIMGGVAVLTKFWQGHQEAKAHVEELTSTLNQQTGAITDNTRAQVIDKLEKEGLLKSARDLGISLTTVTDAALGNKGAMAALRREYEGTTRDATAYGDAERGTLGISSERRNQIFNLIDALSGESGAVAKARDAALRKAEADGRSAAATNGATDASRNYTAELDKARNAVEKLITAEDKRRLKFTQDKRDQLALIETLAAARAEVRNGKRTLDENTAAGRRNWAALLDLGEQWNDSSQKVQNAQGAYAKMRENFIRVADQMGKTRKQAEDLADRILKVPKTADIKFQSKGFRERMAEARELREAIANINATPVIVDFSPRGFGSDFGSNRNMPPTSSSTSPAATPRRSSRTSDGAQRSSGPTVIIEGDVRPADSREFYRDTQRRAQRAGIGGY